ncbi:unnamed protein product [Camellia sinensis]
MSLALFWKFISMASETLEDKKQEEIANVEDKGEVKEEGKTEEGEEEKEAEKKEEDTEMAEKEEEEEEKEELEVKGEASKEEAEEVSKKAKRGRKGSSKKAAKDEKAAKSEPGSKEPVTPIERPIRERKTVERYSEPSTGRSASKALSIEKVVKAHSLRIYQMEIRKLDSWLIWNLTGGANNSLHVTDSSNASRTMLTDLKTLDWDKSTLQTLKIPADILPKIVSLSEIIEKI